jgi:hypothetical protein
MSEELKTSREWQELCKITILDPDGWDRSAEKWDYSWNVEKISREEFEKRMVMSTCERGVRFNENIWRDKDEPAMKKEKSYDEDVLEKMIEKHFGMTWQELRDKCIKSGILKESEKTDLEKAKEFYIRCMEVDEGDGFIHPIHYKNDITCLFNSLMKHISDLNDVVYEFAKQLKNK